jgi:hypothetical protein
MSLKVHFLFSHLNLFPKNLGAILAFSPRYKRNGQVISRNMGRINDGRLLLDVTARCMYQKKKHTADNQLKQVSSQSVKDAILIRNKNLV